jgi:hypothetical protein
MRFRNARYEPLRPTSLKVVGRRDAAWSLQRHSIVQDLDEIRIARTKLKKRARQKRRPRDRDGVGCQLDHGMASP